MNSNDATRSTWLVLHRMAFVVAACTSTKAVAAPTLHASRPNEVVILEDANGDGDYFDAFEVLVFAETVPNAGARIVGTLDRLWTIMENPPAILLIEDSNGDGDALDPFETRIFATMSDTSSMATAIARLPDGSLLVADSANGTLISIRDRNGDGDAFDFAENLVVADGLSQPTSIAVRPDAVVLVAQNNASVPVRIANDLNGDGDYFDFAENLSYVENESPGADLAAVTTTLAFLTRPAAGTILKLTDANGDDDALDVNERLLFADGLTTPTVIARDPANGDLYVSLNDASGAIARLRDGNGDGDALDANEVLSVATGLTQIAGLFIPQPTGPCQTGDADGDGSVNGPDIIIFARRLAGLPTATPICSIDMNSDGALDGRDIQPFVAALLQ